MKKREQANGYFYKSEEPKRWYKPTKDELKPPHEKESSVKRFVNRLKEKFRKIPNHAKQMLFYRRKTKMPEIDEDDQIE